MSNIVRKATLYDLPKLRQFEQGLIEAERPIDPTIKSGNISYYDLTEFIENEDSELLVVENNGQLLASGYAKIMDDKHYLKHKKQGYLGFMYVPQEHRGKGLNKLIVDALIKWCHSKGVYEIRLDVYEDNLPALKAYEKAGFKKHLVNMRLNLNDLDQKDRSG